MAILAIEVPHVNALSTYLHVMLAHHGIEKAKSEYRSALSKTEKWLWVIPIHEPGHWTLVVRIHINTNYSCSLED